MGRPKHALKEPCFFFPYKFWKGGDKDFFSFFLGSQWVPIRFPICSPFLNLFPNMLWDLLCTRSPLELAQNMHTMGPKCNGQHRGKKMPITKEK